MATTERNAKLTDAQLVLLSSASQGADGILLREKLAGAQKTIAALSRRGLLEQHGDDLRITAAGLAAIGLDSLAVQSEVGTSGVAADRSLDAPTATTTPGGQRSGTKRALIITLLQREAGATLDDLIAATDWLPHTTRAALTGLRRKGYAVIRSKEQKGQSVYRIGAQTVRPERAA
jgi:hypothetical protein